MAVQSTAQQAIFSEVNLPSMGLFTAMFWHRLDSAPDSFATFFKCGGAGSGGYRLGYNPGGTLPFAVRSEGSTSVLGTPLVLGQWYHMTLVVSGTGAGQALGYLDGRLDVTQNGSTAGTGNIVLSAWGTDGGEGAYDTWCAFKMWDAALTRSEILLEMKQYAPVRWANLSRFTPARVYDEILINMGGANALWELGDNGAFGTVAGPPLPYVIPQRRRVYFVPGGGVLYTTTLAASLSPSGLIVKQVNKLLSGVASPSGAMRKQPNKVLAASVTPSGNVVKRGLKVLSGVVSPVGTVMVTAIYAIVLAGALAVSGNLVKQVNKRLAGSLVPSGNLMKQGNKVLGGVITPVGSLVKQVNKVLGGTVTPVGSLVVRATYSVILAGVLGVAGSLTKQVNKVLTASLVPTGLLSKQKNMSLSASLGVSGGLVKQVQKVLAATITPVGALTAARRMVVVLAGALAPVGTLVKQVNKRLFGSVAVSGGIVKQVNKVVSGVVSPVGTVRKQVSKVLQGTLIPVGALTGNRIFQVVLSGVLGVSGAVASVFINGSGIVMQGLVPWIRRRRR